MRLQNLCKLPMGVSVATRTTRALLLAALFIMASSVQAAGDSLSLYEQGLFSQTYEQEPLSNRLTRLEVNLFGQAQSGSDAERKQYVLSVLKSLPRSWKTPSSPDGMTDDSTNTPSNNPDNQAANSNQPPTATSQAAPPQRPKDATDYPTVTALERALLGRGFVNDDISVRLSRLETKAFGAPTPNRALADRVDRLLAKYPTMPNNKSTAPEVVSSPLQNIPSDPSQFSPSSLDVYTKVGAMEQTMLTSPVDPNLLLTERLDHLEQQAYGRTFSGESIDTRVNRLMRQFQTGGSRQSGMAPNISPNMPMGYPQQVQNPPQSAARSSRQNIQIGAGFSQNSQTQFSPELMNMLPNDVRTQLMQQGTSSAGTVISAPSTVIIEQQSSQYPGFQTYGGPPIPYNNYYGVPLGQMQSQTTTTIIQPPLGQGGQMGQMTQMSTGGVTDAPSTLPTPAYVGDPAFLQQLNTVEANVFGRVDTTATVPDRLTHLELQILQRAHPELPDAERLNQIFRAWKIQQISRVIGSGQSNGMAPAIGVPLTQP